ncbi:flagellar M-ring protein FliF [bacterium]|nr:flagellar M-ring protein FliF [bacterium]
MAERSDFIANLAKSGRMRVAGALAVTALVGGGLGVIMLQGDQGRTALLYSGLDLAEATEIAGKLDQANIRYEIQGDGSAIFVDRGSVLDARMMLAEEGLPTRGGVGYEIFDKSSALGQTAFVQNINRVRALEGELARTVSSLDMVRAARVHLVLPERRLFERDSQKPSASVVLSVNGQGLSSGQVRAVRNLVAGAVPGMMIERISVLDDRGRLLAAGAENEDEGFGGSNADERRTALEERYRQMVLEIVESVTGPGAARVQVSADVDFNRITQSAETFDPDGRVVRSSDTVEDSSNETSSEPAGETTVANNVPDGEPAAADPRSSSQNTQTRTEERINYEISKNTRTEIVEGGRIKRLSVAVAVDDQRVNGEDGAATFSARAPEELERITALVKSAVGFDEARGDTVEVVNLSFIRPDVSMEGAEAPGAFDFDKFDIIRGAEVGALLLTALALIIFVLRPLTKGLMSKPEDGETGAEALGAASRNLVIPSNGARREGEGFADAPNDAGAGPDGIDVARITGQVRASSIRKISEVVSAHPEESMTIIREWMAKDGAENAA